MNMMYITALSIFGKLTAFVFGLCALWVVYQTYLLPTARWLKNPIKRKLKIISLLTELFVIPSIMFLVKFSIAEAETREHEWAVFGALAICFCLTIGFCVLHYPDIEILPSRYEFINKLQNKEYD